MSGDEGAVIVILMMYCVCVAAIVLPAVAGLWKTFVKAGQPGWGSIIPFYNLYLMVKISGKPDWWVVLFFIPIVNYIAPFLFFIPLAERFGKGTGFGVLCALFPFIGFPILGFGSAQYTPPQVTG